MQNVKFFDVAIVYRGSIARSAQDKNYLEGKPFSATGKYKIYNRSYEYLLRRLQSVGLKAIFTSSHDVLGPGLFKSYWQLNGLRWERKQGLAKSKVLFDKFTPNSKKDKLIFKLLTSCDCIKTFNNKFLRTLFSDKFLTYKSLPNYCLPSVELKNFSELGLKQTRDQLKKLMALKKMNLKKKQKFILKDRSGAGGHSIHKIDIETQSFSEIQKLHKKDQLEKPEIKYIMQPFVDFTGGFKRFGENRLVDLRLIFCGTLLKQTYIRVAQDGNFRCNEHQGGDLIYKNPDEIPESILKDSNSIVNFLKNQTSIKNTVYALDFLSTKSGENFLIEGNSNPGIDWNAKKQLNAKKTKELIHLIAGELSSICNSTKGSKCTSC